MCDFPLKTFLFNDIYFIVSKEKPLTPGSKARSTTPNLAAGSSGPKVGQMGAYPPYAIPGARSQDHLSSYNNVASSACGRPPIIGYDGHPHSRTPSITTNGLGTVSGGKP